MNKDFDDIDASIQEMTIEDIRAELLANDVKMHHKTGHKTLAVTLEAVRDGTYSPEGPNVQVDGSVQITESAQIQTSAQSVPPAEPAPAMPSREEQEEPQELPALETAPIKKVARPSLATLGHRPGAAAPQKEEDLTPTQKALRLVRIVVVPNDPLLASYPGLIFTVGSSRVNRGRMVKKFVPFGNEEGWHVPHIIYEQILNAEMQKFRTVKLPNGEKSLAPYISKKFNVTVLPPLTQAELKKLASAQKARQLS